MCSAPTLKIWMTPFASVAMLEKLALLKIARKKSPRLKQRLFGPLALVDVIHHDAEYWLTIVLRGGDGQLNPDLRAVVHHPQLALLRFTGLAELFVQQVIDVCVFLEDKAGDRLLD